MEPNIMAIPKIPAKLPKFVIPEDDIEMKLLHNFDKIVEEAERQADMQFTHMFKFVDYKANLPHEAYFSLPMNKYKCKIGDRFQSARAVYERIR
jgi:hypothetical protein